MQKQDNAETLTQLDLLKLCKNGWRPAKPVRQATDERRSSAQSHFWTTREAMKVLKLPSPSPLYQARSEGRVYRQGNQIVYPAGRNQWEIFHLVQTRT